MAKYDEMGREIPDTTPVEIPLRYSRRVSETVRIRNLIHDVLSDRASNSGAESFEEANDFDCGEDDMIKSPHEYDEDDETILSKALRDIRQPAKVPPVDNSSTNGGSNVKPKASDVSSAPPVHTNGRRTSDRSRRASDVRRELETGD